MSRIGKKGIVIPEKVEVKTEGSRILVKGPLGELSRVLHKDIHVAMEGGQVVLTPEVSEASALWGTNASHVKNMVEGVSKGFAKKLQIEGIGYKAELKGDKLAFALGFSHPVLVPLPAGVKATVEKNIITLSGIDKEVIGEFAARLRALKKPEPYKGKGIRYEGEVVKIKQGKKAVT